MNILINGTITAPDKSQHEVLESFSKWLVSQKYAFSGALDIESKDAIVDIIGIAIEDCDEHIGD